MNLDFDGALVFSQLVALHLPDLDLPVIDRTALLQGAKTLGLQDEVQAWQGIRKRWRLGQRDVIALRLTFYRVDGDVDTGNQSFQPGDPRQRHTRANQPEAGVLAEVGLSLFHHFDGGDNSFYVLADMQVGHLAHLDALVHQLGLANLDTVTIFEADLDLDACFAHGLPGQPEANEQRHQR
ncbi:hypothetical protein D9M72_385350 [compost metagenome]